MKDRRHSSNGSPPRARSCPNTTDQRISTMGPVNNAAYGASTGFRTTATYHPVLDRYLVTWTADNDFPGLVDNELERYGQALDGR